MNERLIYSLLADAILIIHLLVIIFVVGGFLFILAGYWREWAWIRNPWFRLMHLAAIGMVVLQAFLGVVCPLTVWESDLRRLAGGNSYGGGFIEYWLHQLIFYEAETWVFNVVYVSFGLLVLLTSFLIPPRFKKETPHNDHDLP